MEENVVFQYVPISSFVHPTFWHKLSEIKINVDKLSDKPRMIKGFYSNFSAGCFLEVDYSAFNSDFSASIYNFFVNGILYNKNTIEEFKECDKKKLLEEEGKNLLQDIQSGKILDNPQLLCRFLILSFADLKCHKYYYWFGFPCPMHPITYTKKKDSVIKIESIYALSKLEEIYNALENDDKAFFVVYKTSTKTCKVFKLKEFFTSELEKTLTEEVLENVYFSFSDPSNLVQPSWFLRLFVSFLYYSCQKLHGKWIHVLAIRLDQEKSIKKSLTWKIFLPVSQVNQELQFVGWEPNQNGKMTPRCVDMAESMDPAILSENSINLNLKLLKWRVLPDIDLKLMSDTKCLLFGAGTLGCGVARNLLGWGFKSITFLDNGKISYSNPVRQSLFTNSDAAAGNKSKALTAAERIKEINPNADSRGYDIFIPMPGHPVGDSMRAKTLQDLNKIITLVEEHDVIFLLTDSRESRWLPTVLGSYSNKIVINAALGFDSYLVMRHGARSTTKKDETIQPRNALHCILGSDLGCYFCNDVTAPGNSTKDRTLDQQCTVTRPAVSNIAASYAVELLVSVLQHKEKNVAPAYYIQGTSSELSIPEGMLGIIPHSIRGMLSNFENIFPATFKFKQCIACSEVVLNEFKNRSLDFLFDVFESTKYLEELTGISELQNVESEIIEFSDDSELEISE